MSREAAVLELSSSVNDPDMLQPMKALRLRCAAWISGQFVVAAARRFQGRTPSGVFRFSLSQYFCSHHQFVSLQLHPLLNSSVLFPTPSRVLAVPTSYVTRVTSALRVAIRSASRHFSGPGDAIGSISRVVSTAAVLHSTSSATHHHRTTNPLQSCLAVSTTRPYSPTRVLIGDRLHRCIQEDRYGGPD